MPSVAETSAEGCVGAESQLENGNCNNRAFDESIYIFQQATAGLVHSCSHICLDLADYLQPERPWVHVPVVFSQLCEHHSSTVQIHP
jgi:hypothetical protein